MQLVGILIVAEPSKEEMEEIKSKDLPISGDLKCKSLYAIVISSKGYWLYSS